MTAYYNEHDPHAAQWLRNLIAAGHIAPGVVDENDIRDIKPYDLKQYTQCHFFAGIGVWSLALRQAGWPDDQPVWTGSCPCQPFSAAGRGAGFADERHLWPAWFHLITQLEPRHIFGEQVGIKDSLKWLDLVQTDLENAEYAHGAVDLCAAGVGSPNIRQRLWFVAERMADATDAGFGVVGRGWVHSEGKTRAYSNDIREAGRLEHPELQHERPTRQQSEGSRDATGSSEISRLADTADSARQPSQSRPVERKLPESSGALQTRPEPAAPTNGFWSNPDWLFCRDGKWRPVEPGTSPLVDGAPARVGRLRAYGNAINAEAATAFIAAYLG